MGIDAAANASVLAGMNGASSYNSGKWGAVISLFVFTCGLAGKILQPRRLSSGSQIAMCVLSSGRLR